MGGKPSVPDVDRLPSDRTFLITGANSGIGYTTAKKIAQLGGRVIIACRNEEKAKKAIEEMKADTVTEFAELDKNKKQKVTAAFSGGKIPTLNVQYMPLDLSSLSSTMEFIKNYKDSGLPLNVLICNAGAVFVEKLTTDDGHEQHFQVNYLSHLLLTLHLLPVLKSSGPNSRIINVSSVAHKFAIADFNNLQSTSGHPSKFYGNSKLFQIMSMYSLSRLLPNDSVSVFSLHPGFIQTELFTLTTGPVKVLMNFFEALGVPKDVSHGVVSSLMLALDPKYNGQTMIYIANGKETSPNSTSRNKAKQDLLWKYSMECLKDYINDELFKEIEMKSASSSVDKSATSAHEESQAKGESSQ